MSTQSNNHIHWIIWLSIALFLVIGISFGAVSYIPYEWLKAKLDALSVDGNAEKFTRQIHLKTILRLQFSSMGFVVLSVVCFFFKNTLHKILQNTLSNISFLNLYRTIKNHIHRLYHETSPANRLLIFVLFIIGFALRLSFLFQPMRHDEAFTFTNYASKPLILALSNYSFPNNHLFHTFLVHLSYMCFGNHEWVIRLPAFIAGLLFLPALYLTIRQFYTNPVALIALSLAVTASPLIEYSTNARGYIFICLFFLLLLSAAKYLIHHSNKTIWVCFSVLGALGLYTIPIMVYPLAIVFIWFLAMALKTPHFKTHFRKLFIAGISIVLLATLFYAPVLLGSGPQALFANRFVRAAPSWSSFFDALWGSHANLWQQWTLDYPLPLSIILLVSLIIGCLTYLKRNTIPLLIAIPICLCLITLQRVVPPERTWLFLLPLLFAWVGMGMAFLVSYIPSHRLQKISILVLVLFLIIISLPKTIYNLTDHYPYGPGTLHDAHQITHMLSSQLTETDRVLTIATAAPLEYYFHRQNVSIQHLRSPIKTANRIFLIVMESKYTLEEVLKRSHLPLQRFTKPKLWHRYKSAAIYTLMQNPQFETY